MSTPGEPVPTIYTISGSPAGWRVMLGFAFTRRSYKVCHLEGSKKEHEGADYLALNPRGKVPVLKVGELIIRDSLAILMWMHQTDPESSLLGASQEECAKILSIAHDANEYLLPATNAVVFPAFRSTDIPLDAGGAERERYLLAANQLVAEWQVLEQALSQSQFLGANSPSMADAVVFPEWARLKRALQTRANFMSVTDFHNLDQEFPNLSSWTARIAALPGVDNTVPIHWKD